MDNLELMKQIEDNSIDLIYGDILYGTGKKFADYQDLKADRNIIDGFYIPRIKEMHRILKSTGSIYLQMDYRITHWVRCILDDVFGYKNFKNEIIWQYGLGNAMPRNNFLNKHDSILFYSKSNEYNFNIIRGEVTSQMKAKYCHEDSNGKYMLAYGKKYYLKGGKQLEDVWNDISAISATSKERNGYNTQKPKKLIERIIETSSNEGETIADFFCGGGVVGEVAIELNRKYILCDINAKAIEISETRIREHKRVINSVTQ